MDMEQCKNCEKSYLKKSGGLRKHELLHPDGKCKSKKKNVVKSRIQATQGKNRGRSVGERSVNEMQKFKARSKSVTPSSSFSVKSKSTEFMFGSIDPGIAAILNVVVHAILEQHERYSVPELRQFVIENYPDVPDELIENTILVASSAAWYVAGKFHLRESLIHSTQKHHQVQVDKISRSMLSWFTGFRNVKTHDTTKVISLETTSSDIQLTSTGAESSQSKIEKRKQMTSRQTVESGISVDNNKIVEMLQSAANDHNTVGSSVNGSTRSMTSTTMSECPTETDLVKVSTSHFTSTKDFPDMSAIASMMYYPSNINDVQGLSNDDLTTVLSPSNSTVTDVCITQNDELIDSSIMTPVSQSPAVIGSSIPTKPNMTTLTSDLPTSCDKSVIEKVLPCSFSMPNVSTDELYDPLTTTCAAEYDPENPSMNQTPSRVFATNLDLSDDTEQLFNNIDQFNFPVSMSQTSYGKITEKVYQRVAMTSIYPQLKKGKLTTV